jgi:limonene-1,2-epoxide hydrolase
MRLIDGTKVVRERIKVTGRGSGIFFLTLCFLFLKGEESCIGWRDAFRMEWTQGNPRV